MFNKKKRKQLTYFLQNLSRLYQIKYGVSLINVQISHFCVNVILLVVKTNSLLCENSDLQSILSR